MAGNGSGVLKLSNENYEVWRILMLALFVRKGVKDVAIGDVERPLTGPNSNAGKAWQRKNDEALAEMILNVEVDQLAHMTSDIASKIWEELEKVHRARGLATRISLRRRFLTMRMKEDQRMASWIADVRSVAFQLKKIDVKVEDEDIVLVLTMGLPPSYDNFVTSLDGTPSDELTVDYVIGRLLNEESRQAVATESGGEPNIAAAVSHSNPKRVDPRQKRQGLDHITCYKCGEKGHFQMNCPQSSKPKESANVAASPNSDNDTFGSGTW